MFSAVMALGVAVLVAAGSAALAQSTLPPTPPTSIASPASPADDPAPVAAPARRAQVGYQLGQLTVIAENSSLDEILHEVARQTGMKITGGVIDQRVYGTYGPALPAIVLGRLLEGSGSNMVLRETTENAPTELILTPMQGGPISSGFAPDPPAAAYQSPAIDRPAPQSSYIAPQQPVPPPQSPRPTYFEQPQTNPPTPTGPTPAQPVSPAQANPQSPNGVLTPQQIYEQLQQLQRQKAQPPAGSQ